MVSKSPLFEGNVSYTSIKGIFEEVLVILGNFTSLRLISILNCKMWIVIDTES